MVTTRLATVWKPRLRSNYRIVRQQKVRRASATGPSRMSECKDITSPVICFLGDCEPTDMRLALDGETPRPIFYSLTVIDQGTCLDTLIFHLSANGSSGQRALALNQIENSTSMDLDGNRGLWSDYACSCISRAACWTVHVLNTAFLFTSRCRIRETTAHEMYSEERRAGCSPWACNRSLTFFK